MKTYRMNRASPIYEDLKRIFLKTESLGDFLSKELSGLGGLTYALIYGSFARGEEKEKSDIDLLIIGDVPEEKVVGMISDVERQIGREVNYILWSTTEFENRCRGKHPFLAEIAARPVIGLIGDMDEFRKAAARQENRKNTRK
ncbi:MAG: nucleotidyltransferase domain-containing protein [Chloroflexi bacterium]|nr:nucleotidyltransferase domain-containing protein [Chloroflexota bacterium]